MSELQNTLIDEFQDADYAQAYMDSHVNDKLASQIYWSRRQRGWTQQELAARAGMAQERVSKIEVGDFTGLNMGTLRKFARALDVSLDVGFRSFAHGIHEVCNLTTESLAVKGRIDSLVELEHTVATLTTMFGSPVFIGGGIVRTSTPGAARAIETSGSSVYKATTAAAPATFSAIT